MAEFEPGTRVRLLSTTDEYTALQPGTLGTVKELEADVDGGLKISVAWDDGSTLAMLPDAGDRIEPVDLDT